MAIVRVNPNLEAELTRSTIARGPMERALGDVADLIALRAKMIARAEFYRTGAYLRGITAEHGLDEHGELVGRVNATDWKSHWAEFGWRGRTGGTRARRVLSRAAQQAGFAVVTGGLVGRPALSSGRPALTGRSLLAITGR